MPGDVEEESTLNIRHSKALLIVATTLAQYSKVSSGSLHEMFLSICELNDADPTKTWSDFETLLCDMQYLLSNASSTRWTTNNGQFLKMLDRTFSLRIDRIPNFMKEEIRGLCCSLCGQVETNCRYLVHFVGNIKYSAKSSFVSDLDKLNILYDRYTQMYNSICDVCEDESDDDPDDAFYFGIVIPGETCLRRILCTFAMQDFVRKIIDDTFVRDSSVGNIDGDLIVRTASQIDQLRESGRGAQPLDCAVPNNDDFFQNCLLAHARSRSLELNGVEILKSGYQRMAYTLEDACEAAQVAQEEDGVEDEEEEEEEEDTDEDDDALIINNSSKRRKIAVVTSDSEEESSTSIHPLTEHETFLRDALNCNKNTASLYRQHPGNVIGSRRSTAKKISKVGCLLLETNNLGKAASIFRVLTTLVEALENKERGVRKTHLECSNLLIHAKRVLSGLIESESVEGRHEEARVFAEVLMVLSELLC